MKKIIIAVLALVALCFSFYTEPLSEHNAREAMKKYNPGQIVDYCWENSMDALIENALPLGQFVSGLQADPAVMQNNHGRLLGIGSNVFYVIKGEASNVTFADNEFIFESDGVRWHIPTKYIFGNVARDASGWFDIGEFQNTMDFNSVSACINQRIREQVVAPFLPEAGTYTSCSFCAAIEVKPGRNHVDELTLFPYILSME